MGFATWFVTALPCKCLSHAEPVFTYHTNWWYPHQSSHTQNYDRTNSRFAPSQWETALLCNDVSRWLGSSPESAMYGDCFLACVQAICNHAICETTNIMKKYVWATCMCGPALWSFVSLATCNILYIIHIQRIFCEWLSQWGTALQYIVDSHWLCPYTEWFLTFNGHYSDRHNTDCHSILERRHIKINVVLNHRQLDYLSHSLPRLIKETSKLRIADPLRV